MPVSTDPDLTDHRARLRTRAERIQAAHRWELPAEPAGWNAETADPFPEWVTEFRAPQLDAVGRILEQFRSGKKVVFLNAPTGTGKTLIAEMVRRQVGGWGRDHHNAVGSGLYVCTTKALQDQFLVDFPSAAVLKGRVNYPVDVADDDWAADVGNRAGNAGSATSYQPRRLDITAADCTSTRPDDPCRWCGPRDACPYQIAKHNAKVNPLAVLNTAYLLADLFTPGKPTFTDPERLRDLAVFDEADLLESELMGSVSVSISKRRAEQMGLAYPDRKTVEESWVAWAEYAVGAVADYRAKLGDLRVVDTRRVKEIRSVERLLGNLKTVARELADDPSKWVYNYDDRGSIEFKPVRIDKWGPDVARSAKRVLIMSATIISAEQMAMDLGFDAAGIEWGVVDVPMGFPVENRPVYVVPVAEMTNKAMRASNEPLRKMKQACAAVCERHPDERVLIHAVSYRLSREIAHHLQGQLDRPVITYERSADKDRALADYLAAWNRDAIMVAPSMDRGIDLPGDACRVQIIAKVPYPNLGDKQVAARLHSSGGQGWFTMQTVRTVVQMTGRAVRSKDDWAVTWVLDAQFSSLFNKTRRLLPKWWIDGIDWRGSPSPHELCQ